MSVRAKHKSYRSRKKVNSNRVGKFRRNHQDTAREAAFRIAPISGPQRQLVYDTLVEHSKGLTDEEIIAITGLNPKSENPRRGELVDSGWVIATKKRRLTESGRKAIVWKAVI